METEATHVKKFLLGLLLFAAPLVLVFGVATFALVQFGEVTPISTLVQAQQEDSTPVLLGLAYSNPDRYLKLQSLIERQPTVAVVGTSRSMQFRSPFFTNSTTFYNAGGGIETIQDLQPFLSNIPAGKEPEVMIVVLDQYFFNDAFDMQERPFEKPSFARTWQYGITRLLPDYMQQKFRFGDVFAGQEEVKKVGLNAIVNTNGFLNDGSYHYGKVTQDPTSNPDYEFADTFARIEAGNRRFQYATDVSREAVEELGTFLELAQQRGIYVIGVLPPYAHAVYERMMAMEDKYAYIPKLQPTLEPIFVEHGFWLYDFSDLATLGASDAETIDGFHGSEKAYVRLTLAMARDNKVLQQYVDAEYLAERLEQASGDYYVFEITE